MIFTFSWSDNQRSFWVFFHNHLRFIIFIILSRVKNELAMDMMKKIADANCINVKDMATFTRAFVFSKKKIALLHLDRKFKFMKIFCCCCVFLCLAFYFIYTKNVSSSLFFWILILYALPFWMRNEQSYSLGHNF